MFCLSENFYDYTINQILQMYTGCPKKKYSGLIRNNF